MGSFNEIAKDMEVSPDGLMQSAGRYFLTGQAPEMYAPGASLTANAVYYQILGKIPTPAVLEDVILRVAVIGHNDDKVDILKVASGTAQASGTAMITQIDGDSFTADTDYVAAIIAADKTVTKGDLIVAKVTSVVTNGIISPVSYDLRLRV